VVLRSWVIELPRSFKVGDVLGGQSRVLMTSAQSTPSVRDAAMEEAPGVVKAWFPVLIDACTPEEIAKRFARMITAAAQAKLPKRRRRTYPRAIWGRPQEWPRRTVRNQRRCVRGGK